jgi:hypothetical protein
MTAGAAARGVDGRDVVACWCCGQARGEADVVRLGSHPEVAVCLGCARFLHQRARAREDSLRPSPGTRVRNAIRAGRSFVVQRGWQDRRLLGPLLRRLDRHLP